MPAEADPQTCVLVVRKDRLDQGELRLQPPPALRDGQVRVRIDLLSLTANNVTYAAFGDSMSYWGFFPTGEAATGIVPAWGFGRVVESGHPEVAEGERLYGYWPMASDAVLEPGRVRADGFSDQAAHRQSLHAVYNRYLRCATDPLYTADSEAVQALLRPLYSTSWLIDDFFADSGFFDADSLLLSSASSKTAYGTAFQLARRSGIEVIGLTSAANRDFCQRLGCYHRVLGYDELEALAPDRRIAYVDFAGSASLRRAVHERFGQLTHSCAIGGTHVTDLGGAGGLPGPRPTLFFAPARVRQRSEDWGAQELARRLAEDWHAFRQRVVDPASPWLTVRSHRGGEAVLQAWQDCLAGRFNAEDGHVLHLGPAATSDDRTATSGSRPA